MDNALDLQLFDKHMTTKQLKTVVVSELKRLFGDLKFSVKMATGGYTTACYVYSKNEEVSSLDLFNLFKNLNYNSSTSLHVLT